MKDNKMSSDYFLKRILEAIQEKMQNGYTALQLEVNYGVANELDKDSEGYPFEGFYISKLNGFGSTPITDVIAFDGQIDEERLIKELDKLGISYCF